MNKTILGVAMVVVFCITFWLVAGGAWQASKQALQASKQALQAQQQAWQAYQQQAQAVTEFHQAGQAFHQAFLASQPWQQAYQQARQASIMADAHWRTQRSWGIGAGLLADVLVGALAWSKLTAKA